MRLKGETVYLHVKTPAGKDAFNRQIYNTERVAVHDVLIAPVAQDAGVLLSEMAISTKGARYQLGIPKGDTHDWEDCTVEFWGQTWKSVGFSTAGMDHQIPLRWNRKVMVERYG